MTGFRWLASIAMGIAMVQTADAARPLGPPIEEMLRQPSVMRVAAVEAGEGDGAGLVKFTLKEAISGESPELLTLRVDAATSAEIQPGKPYVIAWTDIRKNALLRDVYEKDPNGPSIATVRGLSLPAVYEDTPQIRLLLESGKMTEPPAPGAVIDALLEQMKREDRRSRNLVVAQLYLSPGLESAMDAAQLQQLREILSTAELSAENRDYLLQVALRLDPQKTAPWLAEEFRRVIILNGTQYDLSSYVPGLVKTAAGGLGQRGQVADVPLLGLLLYANNPGVSKAALAALDHLSDERAVQLARQAVARGWIAPQTERALEQYLEKRETAD